MAEVKIPDMIEAFGFPITLAFSESRKAYLSERISGNLWEIEGGTFRLIRHFDIVNVLGHHETGLLGIALDGEFEKNGYIYCYYTYGRDLKSAQNKVVRVQIGKEGKETLLDNIPAGAIHNGGIMVFGPDGNLYIGVGVQNEIMERSQDISWLGGKVLRITPDGQVPADNPFPGSPVYSYGHRNIFGLAFHPETGKLYISEDGPDKDDAINIIEKGGNYGWPHKTGFSKNPKYIDPIIAYTPTITPTQCCFYGGDFYFGSYNEGSVHRLVLDKKNPARVLKDEVVYKGRSFGTIGVFASPSGDFYVTTPNKIMRFEPK